MTGTLEVKQTPASDEARQVKGIVFDIQRFAVHDGPGIRTLVFLKGCSLRCRWCANPESIQVYPQVGFIKANCNRCGKCPAACPKQAITLNTDGMPVINRALCDNCGKCVEACLPRSLILYGREQTAQQVYDEVKRDKIFYASSGGGVTVSGGEPLRQAAFVKALFTLCREGGIHTAVETCGAVSKQVFHDVLKLTDYVLFDLKHIDPEVHKEYTGRTNRQILENARLVAKSGVPFLFRLPLIPGVNDTSANIEATADFIKSVAGGEGALELMPYHRMGTAKYEALDMPYTLRALEPPTPEKVERTRSEYEKKGLRCLISR